MRLRDGSDLVLRPATAADAQLIVQMIRELAAYEKLEHEVQVTEALLKQNLFSGGSSEVRIAERNGLAVAFALFFPNFSTFLGKPGIYLEDLFVRDEFRGLGIGQVMLAHLAQLCVERGGGRLEWSVLDWNKSAIGFYENLGAKPMNGWQVYRLTGTALLNLARSASTEDLSRKK